MLQKTRALRIGGALLLAVAISTPAGAERAYLDDANRRSPSQDRSLDNLNHGYPKVLVHELEKSISNDAYTKYDFIDAHGQHFPRVEKIQSQSPSTKMLRHISGRAYQSYNYNNCVISGGLAFESTTSASQGGPSSTGCGIYAGHWMYKAGTRTRQSIAANTSTIPVTEAARITSGSYVVIYDSPAGSFRNAEHARVTGVNRTNNTISVSRGFKSAAKAHPTGAVVAEHVLGQGSNKELWAYNLSSQSPRDANGRTFGEFYADWIGKNLMRYDNGKLTSAQVSGVMFDADFYYELNNTKSDVNNDLVVDNGLAPGGTNWLGEGLDSFYQRTTNRLPGKYVLTGVHDGRGYDSAYGTQMENWLDYGNGDFAANPKYDKLEELFAGYLFNMAERSQGPALVHNLSKTPTRAYKKGTTANSNAPFRLALALTLMDNGYFGFHSNVAPDAWFDEYAVDAQKGSSNYGRAINKSNPAQVRQHTGWLGKPLGTFRRIYSDTTFAPDKSMIGNGSFDGNVNGWSAANVNISRASSGAFEGSGALSISPMINFKSDLGGANAKSPTLSVTSGQTYTVALAMRSSAPRDVRISLGNAIARVPVGTKWRRYVLNLKPTKGGSTRLNVNVGLEETQVWVDSVYVFRGETNVFAREFERGMVLANASGSSKTVSVGSNFRRISGSQDPAINNGQNVTSVTIPAYDGLVLVRREGAGGGGTVSGGGDSTAGTGGSGSGGGGSGGSGSGGSGSGGSGSGSGSSGSGSGSIGDLVWRDADGNGIQGNSESGWSGVTLRLRSCNGAVLKSTTTDAGGGYTFGNLGAGKYQIEVVAPSGARISPKGAGKDGSRNSDAHTDSGMTWCTSIGSAGENRTAIDVGLVPGFGGGGGSGTSTSPGSGSGGRGGSSLGDYVWNDKNRDGIQNNVEPGLGGIKIKLRDCNGIYKQTTFTDNKGAYSFRNLGPGSYMVHFITPSKMKRSPEGVGKEGKDSDATGTGLSQCITLGSSDNRGGIDAGFH